MMMKFPIKSHIFAVFCLSAVFFFSACLVEPVGLGGFLENDKVKEIVKKSQAKVNLTDDSDPGLVAGDGKITELNPDKYYVIEELDEDNNISSTNYVTPIGSLSDNIILIGRVSGRTINGLKNDSTYRVYSAVPLNGAMTYYDTDDISTVLPTDGIPIDITNGVFQRHEPKEDYYLDLDTTIDPTNIEIAMVPITPPGSNNLVSFISGGNIIELPGANTSVDFIFVEKDSDDEIVKFRFLEVVILGSPELTINISLDFMNEHAVTFTPALTTVPQSALLTGTTYNLTISGAGISNIEWFYNGNPIGSNATLTLSLSTYSGEGYFTLGDHEFAVGFTVGTIPYCANYTIKVE